MRKLMFNKRNIVEDENREPASRSAKNIYMKVVGIIVTWFNKVVAFDVTTAISTWWSNESSAAKVSFIYALIVGFISHIFVYTGRYYGRDDMGIIVHNIGPVATGRWFHNTVISVLTYKYVLPLVYGILVSFFLAVAAFYVCKIYKIEKKINAVLIGLLLSTFPSIANTNLFLYATASYHLGVLLAVLAVYITIRYRYGSIIGAVLSMLVLATYQAKFNIILALSLFYLIAYLIDMDFSFKKFFGYVARILSMVVLGGISYAISLPISFSYYNTSFNNYRGFSADSMQSRLLTTTGFKKALVTTYENFRDGFFGNIYLIVDGLKYAYVVIAILSLIFLCFIIISKKLYKKYVHLFLIAIMIILVPFASNFANFFDSGNAYGLMIYAFVLTLAFAIFISEQCTNIHPIFKSVFTVCMFIVIGNYIVGNNVYYLRAYYIDQRTFSIHTRILDRIDPFLANVNQKRVGLFGTLPNEWYPRSSDMFNELGGIRDGASLNGRNYIGFGERHRENSKFVGGVNRFHGVNLTSVGDGSTNEKRQIAKAILDMNMPAWPAEGSVGIINDVIVVNFGLADVVFESDESGQFFRARHWVSEGHANHKYEYRWQVYRNGTRIENPTTNSDRLYLHMPNTDDEYRITVTVRNTNTKYNYPQTEIKLSPGSYAATYSEFENYLANVLSDERIVILSVKDEASRSINVTMQEALQSLGLREELKGKYRYSYAAIINGYDVIFEQLSNEEIKHNETVEDSSIEIISAGFNVGNISSILINSEEYSLNKRGINIVVLNKATGEIVDSVAFDTFSPKPALQR